MMQNAEHFPTATFLDGNRLRVNNIYCIGRNFAEHAKELNNPVPAKPVLFLKSNASFRNLSATGEIFSDESFHHEVEVVLVIGHNVKKNSKFDLKALAGIAVGLDLTRREVQSELKAKGLPWTISKSFAGSAIVSDIAPIHSIGNSLNFTFELLVNDTLKQRGKTDEMIFSYALLFEFIASFHDLYPGDLIFTGTPSGVGPVKKGDRIQFKLNQNTFNGTI